MRFNLKTYSQHSSYKYNLGINFVTLYSGTPELQFDYFVFKRIGLSSNLGYTYKAIRGGFILVGDNAEIRDLKGYFLKLGLKYQSNFTRKKNSTFWYGQLLYIFSAYNEVGVKSRTATTQEVELKGFVNGIAVVAGIQVKLIKRINFRFRMQWGYYSKRDHLGYPGHTLRPGIGASGQIFNNQLTLGLTYRFGKIKEDD